MNPAHTDTAEVPMIDKLSDAERAETAARTGGAPLLSFDGESTPYIDYGSTTALLSLQNPRSGTHDELSFYISGQVQELLFKLLHAEIVETQARLRAGETVRAVKLLQRAVRIQEAMVKFWDIISTLSPSEYNGFRDHLGSASGFQSYMYRHLEFVLGRKDANMTRPHRGVREVYDSLVAALNAPSVYDDAIALLARRGYDITPELLHRDWSASHERDESVEAAWVAVYSDPREDNDLFLLAEALMGVAEQFSLWRMRHLIAVERVIGFKPGTGGTAGAGWLRRIAEHRFFPELWTARTQM
jgi:tryptophan 2,3-dioxygenase